MLANKDTFMVSTKLAFAGSHPKFIKYLEERGLTDWEISYCCLYALGLKGKEVGSYIKMRSHYNNSSEVREKLVALQQQMGRDRGVVMDGRDIGTHVLPNADVKVYLTASVETRANRRYLELQEKGVACDLQEIAHDIEERDTRDMNREIAPLKQAEDAVYVDSSDMTIDEVVDKICALASGKM